MNKQRFFHHGSEIAHWLIVETELPEAEEALADDLHDEFIEFCKKEAVGIISSEDNLMRLRPNDRAIERWAWCFEARLYHNIPDDLWFKLCEKMMQISLSASVPLKVIQRRVYNIQIREELQDEG